MVMHTVFSRLTSVFPFLTWPRLDAALRRREGLAGMTVGPHTVALRMDAELSIQPNPGFTTPVLDWFDTRIVRQERFKDLEMEVKTEAKAEGGIPLLASLLTSMSSKFRGGASYREELRREIRDGFAQLLQHFNALVAHANHLLKQQGRGPLLFIIDGSDKLAKEDADLFFSGDLNQVGQIEANFIICAPSPSCWKRAPSTTASPKSSCRWSKSSTQTVRHVQTKKTR